MAIIQQTRRGKPLWRVHNPPVFGRLLVSKVCVDTDTGEEILDLQHAIPNPHVYDDLLDGPIIKLFKE